MNLEERVDPEYLPMVATFTATDRFSDDLPTARRNQTEAMAKLSKAAESPDIAIQEINLPTSDGTAEFMVRIYTPNPAPETSLPVMVWAHGGGYVVGHPVEHDNIAINFVRGAGCAVVSVDYRLAPEHPYPAAIEDCYTAMQWVASNPEGFNFNVEKIAVGGYSAGGGLGAAMALVARDRGGPKVVFQMPLCACLDDRHLTPSAQEFTDGRVWSRAISENAWDFYLIGVDRANTPPHAAPARATDLAGLPPAYFGIGELDLMRDENIDYANRMQQAGVSVELHVFPGAFHGFDLLGFDKDLGKRALTEYGVVLKRAFDNAK